MTHIVFMENRSSMSDAVFARIRRDNMRLDYWREQDEAGRQALAAQAQYLIVGATPVTAGLMASMPQLKMVLRCGTGYDNVDLAAARAQGVMVANAAGANANSVAEMTIGHILALYHKIPFLDRRLRAGHWDMFMHRGNMFEMRGKTHAIIGMGAIGRRVAELSRPFGTHLTYWNRHRLDAAAEQQYGLSYLPLPELLAGADIVSLHVAAAPETHHLINAHTLRQMKPNAILINMARGSVVDEAALAQALQQGIIAGAGLDTYEQEPLPPQSPLLQLDNFVGTPHEAAGSSDTFAYILEHYNFADILRVENGQAPENRVA